MSTARRLTRPARVVRARTRWLRERLLHRREVRSGRRHGARADRTPIFILGAPRSGTTLLYQLLVEGLDVGWLANAHLRSPGDVARIERRERPRAARVASDFESSHGTTRQPWEPSEAGEYWYRFFPRDRHQLHAADATAARMRALAAAVREFMDACSASAVFKNVLNSLRVPVLAAALPESRFVLIERDEEANARSLLAGRARRGDLGDWWSARPDGADALAGANPAEQVVWQVRRMNEVARAQLAALGAQRALVVRYEELCADPQGAVVRIHAWLESSGAQVARRSDAKLPERFDVRAGGSLPEALELQLRAALASAPSGEDGR